MKLEVAPAPRGAISALDLYTIGIGPSSSHCVGPMRAAKRFVAAVAADGTLDAVGRVRAELYGSLALTGKGHGTDRAVLAGLENHTPETVDPDELPAIAQRVRDTATIRLASTHDVAMSYDDDLVFHRGRHLPQHPNGLRFTALDPSGVELCSAEYFSVGGGFVVAADDSPDAVADVQVPHPFSSGAELLDHCERLDVGIAELMWRNEEAWRPRDETRDALTAVWDAMQRCVEQGSTAVGLLPGPLGVRRRASVLRAELEQSDDGDDPLTVTDWVSMFALAVSEENAAGQRVVTAPTNGAAGIIPAVLHYYTRFVPGADTAGVIDAMLTAAAIGLLYKANASISGAEVGCQGEVGVACSMAAGALAAVTGGTPRQVENAAEIAMEHNLGLTCDPVGGLVQIPCIERNAMGALKAINAQRLALRGDGRHHVSLDQAIDTMRETGADMKRKYKETSRGGLAVNVPEC